MEKAVIYVRSACVQAEGDTGMETQRRACQEAANSRGAEVVAVYEDNGVSGLREDRQGLQAALSLINQREANVLITQRIDRLGRSTEIIQQVARRVESAGAVVITCDGQEIGQTPRGMASLSLLSSTAAMGHTTDHGRKGSRR